MKFTLYTKDGDIYGKYNLDNLFELMLLLMKTLDAYSIILESSDGKKSKEFYLDDNCFEIVKFWLSDGYKINVDDDTINDTINEIFG